MTKKEKQQIAATAIAAVLFLGVMAAAMAPDKPIEQSAEERKLEATDMPRALSYARSQLDGGYAAQFRNLHILILSDGTPADDMPYLCGEAQAGGRSWRGFIAYYTNSYAGPPEMQLVNPNYPVGHFHNQIPNKWYRDMCRT